MKISLELLEEIRKDWEDYKERTGRYKDNVAELGGFIHFAVGWTYGKKRGKE